MQCFLYDDLAIVRPDLGLSVCKCVCERERERVCVCVCVCVLWSVSEICGVCLKECFDI